MIRAAIFDLDGTLVDSIGAWGKVCQSFLFGFHIRADAFELAKITGPLTLSAAVDYLMRTYSLPVSREDCFSALSDALSGMYTSSVSAKTGAASYLSRLKQSGLTLCVVSATPRILVEQCLRKLSLLPYFAFILSCEEIGAGKDSPLPYLIAAERLRTVPDQIAVYEDSYTPLLTAKQAGFQTVAVYDAFSANADASAQLADRVITDWNTACL